MQLGNQSNLFLQRASRSSNEVYENDYFSIESILASSERMPCKFNKAVQKFGILDPSLETEDIPAGSKLELPVWLARHLLRLGVAQVELPKPFRETHRQILAADATVVNLHKFSPYYYRFGLNVLQFRFPESAHIARSLDETFRSRILCLMDLGQNPSGGPTNSQMSKLYTLLDREEQEILQEVQNASKRFCEWQDRKVGKISTATAVENHKKRKREAEPQL